MQELTRSDNFKKNLKQKLERKKKKKSLFIYIFCGGLICGVVGLCLNWAERGTTARKHSK